LFALVTHEITDCLTDFKMVQNMSRLAIAEAASCSMRVYTLGFPTPIANLRGEDPELAVLALKTSQ